MKKTTKKSVFKEGYYWEFKPLYDTLPENLPVVKYSESVFGKAMKYREILDTFKVTPERDFEAAASVAASAIPSIQNGQYRVIFFMDCSVSCGLYVWRGDVGMLVLYVFSVELDGEWDGGGGVLASNESLESGNILEPLELGKIDPLRLFKALEGHDDVAIEFLKSNGFRITKEL